MKSIQEFFGKPLSKISKPVRQKFNIYAKYEDSMEPREFQKLGVMLFNKQLKGSSQSLAQGLSPLSIGNVKDRYGNKYSIKANSKPKEESIRTKISNWTKLPDFPQSQGQHHRVYVNPTEKLHIWNYRNEGRKPTWSLEREVPRQATKTLRANVFLNLTRTNEDFEKTKDINSFHMKSQRDVYASAIQIKKPDWIDKVKLDTGEDIKAPYFAQKSIAKRNMKILASNNK